MAEQTSSTSNSGDMEAHRGAFEGFLKGVLGLALISGFTLIALVAFRFAHTLNVLTGFAGLALGLIAVTIDARTGSRWLLSLGLLVLFGLITAIKVS